MRNIFRKILQVSWVLIIPIYHSVAFTQTTTLTVANSSGPPGSVNNFVSISLANQETIAGLVFTVNYDPTILSPSNVTTVNRTLNQSGLGFSIPTDGELLITMFDFDGNDILPSSGELLQIAFDISPDAPPGEVPVTISEASLSSQAYQAIQANIENGVVDITNIAALPAPFNLESQVIDGNVMLSWESPAPTSNEIELRFDDGRFENALGFDDGVGELVNGPFVPPSYPARLTAARFITNGSRVGDFVFLTVYVDSSGLATNPEDTDFEDFTDDLTIDSSQVFQTVDMTDLDITLPQGSTFFVGVFQVDPNNMGVGLDTNAVNGNAFFDDGFEFSPLAAAGFNGVFGIRAVVDISGDGSSLKKTVELMSQAAGPRQKPDLGRGDLRASSFEWGMASLKKASYANMVHGGPLSFNIYRSTSANAARTGSIIGTVPANQTAFEDASLSVATYYYQVTAQYAAGESFPSNEVSVVITAVDDFANEAIPQTFTLEQNYPNPFNPGTNISYTIPQGNASTQVVLAIYDLSGKKIRTLVNERQANGSYQIRWDGRNDVGQTVASGLYVYRLQARKFAESRKMVLLR